MDQAFRFEFVAVRLDSTLEKKETEDTITLSVNEGSHQRRVAELLVFIMVRTCEAGQNITTGGVTSTTAIENVHAAWFPLVSDALYAMEYVPIGTEANFTTGVLDGS